MTPEKRLDPFTQLVQVRFDAESKQGNPMRMQSGLVAECKICSHRQHSCAWEYKLSGDPLTRKVAGGACYSCVRACHLLPNTN